MREPILLDLFCGAGGAAVGYRRAGFRVVGIDHRPQPRFPSEFIQSDALEYLEAHGREYDVIHASPPCQAFSTLRHGVRGGAREYADLLLPVRALLEATGRPYVIENVVGAPLLFPVLLCGSMFGLAVRRHRLFESNCLLLAGDCKHDLQPIVVGVYGTGGAKIDGQNRRKGYRGTRAVAREAMGIDWMSYREISQAIPPAYTAYLGAQLLRFCE